MELMSNTMLVDVCVAYKGIYLSIEMQESRSTKRNNLLNFWLMAMWIPMKLKHKQE